MYPYLRKMSMKRKYINDSLKALYKSVLLNNTMQNSFLANILSFLSIPFNYLRFLQFI